MSTQVSFSENNKTSSILLEFGKLTVDDAADYKCLAVFDSVTIESNPATIAVYGKREISHGRTISYVTL